ncbi:MAG: phosphopentomutase [Gemmatimonadaceae bacterium]|nr:phosphopentomutase [Gemmatimonadaceae bacterium]NUO95724.1 phosphopentomutase [Gemmatimonadaceae bacterium]NUP56997.1 phosphopentomutase [Gemmatimonadaceae bacterium]NUP70588.1 phosphopentomutase [Gemmatimonadaceae bacterium]NUR34148.1 phosphopentomutase [Gemmatimonadaceae bacterium]
MRRRAVILVLDGVGVGAAPDAAAYGDEGSDTLGNLARARGGLRLPHLTAAGLGCLATLPGVPPVPEPDGAWGTMQPASAGKDSTTGHWEIAGLHLARPFPTYPNGFPASVIQAFASATKRGVIGNVAASGTEIIARFGGEHERSGAWIVYTSADSVFQVAAHEQVVPLEELYAACETARRQLVAPHDVSRVIARPFIGTAGAYERTSNRRDYSLEPPGETLIDALAAAGVPRAGVGKVDDLFAGRHLRARHTASNAEGIRGILEWLRGSQGGLLFANLVDFDTLYGHRNDAEGFERALREFDDALPAIREALREDDLLFITADHGNDPTTPSSDHARENVPLLVLGESVHPVALGVRQTFSDLGATVAEWLNVGFRGRGQSFLPTLERGH